MSGTSATKAGLALVGWALLLGCSALGADGPRRARPDLVDLADRVRALEERVAAQQVEIDRLKSARPANAAGGSAAAAPRAAEPTGGEGGEPVAPLSALPSAIETSDLEDLAPPSSSTESAAGQGEESRAYEAAAFLYREGRLTEAEAAFQRLLADHPEGDLADNALFWIGASRLARGELVGAEEAFRRVVELYPEGNKVPDSLWKLGNCRELAGDAEGAEAAYRTLIERFPASEVAESASRRLARSVPAP